LKKKFLALTMASAVMLMGAGYAYWNDTLAIDNTVSTGEFNVKIVSA
jgi:predicted ribosomally synthesized peptide with SipW-like signal peptide